MERARGADERLPWLDSPRPAKPVPAARRARTPLFVLLGLFFASAIALMAYLTGRSTVPVKSPAPGQTVSSKVATRRIPIPAPVPAAPIVVPAPVVITPAPPAAPPVRAAPARPRANPAKLKRPSAAPRASPAKVKRPSAAPRRRANWPARPFAGPRGRVIQLGAYTTPAQADAAWWRVARAYPYLSTLPRVVTVIGPSRGRPRYYRVRLAAGSNREARALCSHLHRIGRGCIIA